MAQWPIMIALPLVIGLVCRVCYLVIFRDSPSWDYLSVDNWYFHNWAVTIRDGNIVGDTIYFRGPLYAWLLAFCYWIAGESLWVPRLLGLILGLCSIALIFQLTGRLFDQRAAVSASLLYALLPAAWYYEADLTAEPLLIVLLLLTGLACLRSVESGKGMFSLITGGLLGAASLARLTALLLAPAILALLLWSNREKNRPARAQTGLAYLLGLVLLIGPVTLRNQLVGNEAVGIAASSGVNLFIGNNPDADGVSARLPAPLGLNWNLLEAHWLAEEIARQPLTTAAASAAFSAAAMQFWIDQPEEAARLFVTKLAWTVSNQPIANNRMGEPYLLDHWMVRQNPIRHGLLLVLLVAGAIATAYSNRRKYLIVAAIICLWLVGTAVYFVCSRFLHPIAPLLCITGGVALTAVGTIRGAGNIAAVCAAVLVASAVSWWPRDLPDHLEERPATFGIALQELRNGRTAHALRLFQSAATLNPNASEVWLNIGVCQFRLGQLDSAEASFHREINQLGNRGKAALNLASLALVRSDSLSARSWLRSAAESRPKDPLLAQLAIRAASPNPAEQQFVDSIARCHQGIDQVSLDAAAWYERSGLTLASGALLERTVSLPLGQLEIDPRLFEPDFRAARVKDKQTRAQLYVQLSKLAGIRGSLDSVAALSMIALQFDSSCSGAWSNLEMSYRQLGQYEKADSVRRQSAEFIR